MQEIERFRGSLLGLACGDAVGTTVEFQSRGSFQPVTDMVGGGVFNLKPGEWTDDTSMALCLADSLVELGRFDPRDQMERYSRWVDDGYMSSNGRCFDIGNTCSSALRRFQRTGESFSGSTSTLAAGNGCIMRLAPAAMFGFPIRELAIRLSGESSRTTHGAVECIEASRLFGGVLFQALAGKSKDEVLLEHDVADLESESIMAIARGDYRHKHEHEIRGSGYVVKSLEAALWCFWHTTTFEAAVLKATNLGDDADTTAAVCGQIAGAFYGESGIPPHWRERIALHDTICTLAEGLFQLRPQN